MFHGVSNNRSQPLYGYRDEYKSNSPGDSFLIKRLTRNGTRGFNFWMNVVRPKVGEKLYDTKLYLMYTVDEISKVSKIEVRPKQPQQAGYNNEVLGIYGDFKEVGNCIDIYNDETKNDEDRMNSIKKAYGLLKKLKDNPLSKDVINPSVIDEYIEKIGSVLK